MAAESERGDAGQVEDLAVRLLHEPGLSGFGHVEDALEVDVHHQVPVLLGHLEEQVVAGDAGVVDQHVDPAELVDHALHGGLGGGRVDDVAADAHRAGTVGELEPAGSLLSGGLVEVEDRDGGALAREALRDAEADASRCSGDDGDTAVVATHEDSWRSR